MAEDKEEISFEDIVNVTPSSDDIENRYFSEGYRQQIFVFWYNNGKLSARKLYRVIPEWEYNGKKPGVTTLDKWIKLLFIPQAKAMDDQVMQRLNQKLVEEKIEMLERHAKTGKELQEIAFNYIKDHKGELTVNSAARLWIAGVETERASRGLPDALRKMNEMSDEKLLAEVRDILENSPAELLPGKSDEDIPDFEDET